MYLMFKTASFRRLTPFLSLHLRVFRSGIAGVAGAVIVGVGLGGVEDEGVDNFHF